MSLHIKITKIHLLNFKIWFVAATYFSMELVCKLCRAWFGIAIIWYLLICPSHSGIVSKWLNVSLKLFHCLIVCFPETKQFQSSAWVTCRVRSIKYRWVAECRYCVI